MIGSCRTVFQRPTSQFLILNRNFFMADTSVQPDIFDSLPYYDDDLQKFPLLKQKVEQELARQPKPPTTLHPRVPPAFEPFAVREQDAKLLHLQYSDIH